MFGQDLILVSSSGDIFKFFIETGHWKKSDRLSIDDLIFPVQRGRTFGYSQSSMLTAVLLASTSDHLSLILLWQQSKREVVQSRSQISHQMYLRQFLNSKWSATKEVQATFFSSTDSHNLYSYAISQYRLYVNNGTAIYCIDTKQPGEKLTVSTITLPSLVMTSICFVNDTMFSFGGKDEDEQPSSDVNRYNSQTKMWEPAGYMRSCRYSTVVSPFLQDKDDIGILVVGGILGKSLHQHSIIIVPCQIAEVCEVGISG